MEVFICTGAQGACRRLAGFFLFHASSALSDAVHLKKRVNVYGEKGCCGRIGDCHWY